MRSARRHRIGLARILRLDDMGLAIDYARAGCNGYVPAPDVRTKI